MDRDDSIKTVYCLVCEHYQVIEGPYRLHRGGFAPALSDEEAITIEICGKYFKMATEPALCPEADRPHPISTAGRQPMAGQSGDPTALDSREWTS